MSGTRSSLYGDWCLTCDLTTFDCICSDVSSRILFSDALDENISTGTRPYKLSAECIDCTFYKTENCVPLIEWLKRRQNKHQTLNGTVAQEDPQYNYLSGEPEELDTCSLFESIGSDKWMTL